MGDEEDDEWEDLLASDTEDGGEHDEEDGGSIGVVNADPLTVPLILSACQDDVESLRSFDNSGYSSSSSGRSLQVDLREWRKKFLRQRKRAHTANEPLHISCAALDVRRCEFECMFYLYCTQQLPERRSRGWQVNPMLMEEFADCITSLMICLGLNFGIDWEVVYVYLSPSDLLLLIYYWKLALRFYSRDKASIDQPMAAIQKILYEINGHSIVENIPPLLKAIRQAGVCSLCSCSFFNAFARVVRTKTNY
jgi:hypothetical protein